MLPISPNQRIAQGCCGHDMDAGPEQHRQPDREADQEGAGHRRADQAGDQLAGRQRRHQIIDDRPLDLADQQREGGIGEGVLDHRHDDQARARGNRRTAPAAVERHRPPVAAQRDGENDQKQQRRDRRRPDGLQLDLEEAAHLLHIEGREAAPIDVPDDGHAGIASHPIRRLVGHRERSLGAVAGQGKPRSMRNHIDVVDRRTNRPAEGAVDQGRHGEPDRRGAGRRFPQRGDRQGAPAGAAGAPVAGEGERARAEPKAKAKPAPAKAAPRRPRSPPRAEAGAAARGRRGPRPTAAEARAAAPPAARPATAPSRSSARSVRAASSARARATSRRRSRRRRRAGWSRPSRAPKSPTRPACSISTRRSANGRSAIPASPISISAATRPIPASLIASSIAASPIRRSCRAATASRRRPLPFGGPRVR